MTRITQQIVEGEFLLNDPGRSFVRMSDLKKKSNRSGRFTDYRFYLFSDVLIYAKRAAGANTSNSNEHQHRGSFAESITVDSAKDEYKIHEELPLHLMKIVDWFPPTGNMDMIKKAFQVHHPRKTFMVFCSSSEERLAWVSDIRAAINREIQRKVEMEAARMAATTMGTPTATTSMVTHEFVPSIVAPPTRYRRRPYPLQHNISASNADSYLKMMVYRTTNINENKE